MMTIADMKTIDISVREIFYFAYTLGNSSFFNKYEGDHIPLFMMTVIKTDIRFVIVLDFQFFEKLR